MVPRLAALAVAAASLLHAGCVGVPAGIEPVAGFDLERYLGTWYELARYDHRFERGLSRVSATYAPREGGGVTVRNRGFDAESGEWSEIRGVARFAEASGVGHLEVSFFRPFFSSYVVFALDPDYRWAWVTGYDRDFLWLLSREPTLSKARWEALLEIAEAHGFDTGRLLRVDQSGGDLAGAGGGAR